MTDARVPRRAFLATTAAALVAAARPEFLNGATLPPRETGVLPRAADASYVKLGVASYSLREFPLDKALEMIKALRTPYVNFKSMHMPYEKSAAELDATRKQVEAAGFQIVGGGTITFAKDTDEDVEKYFAYAKAAGMPTMVSTCAPALLPRVEKFARKYDIKVAIHNHGPEDKHYPSPYDVLKYVKGMDSRMGLCIDVGHTWRTGVDVVTSIKDAGARLHDMHIKDLTNMTSRDSQVAVGEGKLPIPGIFRALESIRYPGYVNLEYEINAKDPLPGMHVSFAYMRGVIAAMA